MCWNVCVVNMVSWISYANHSIETQSSRSKTLEVAETNERITNHHPKRVIASIFQRGWKQSVFFCDAPRNQHNKCLVQIFKTRLECYGAYLQSDLYNLHSLETFGFAMQNLISSKNNNSRHPPSTWKTHGKGGRCEIWTRPLGIQATSAKTGAAGVQLWIYRRKNAMSWNMWNLSFWSNTLVIPSSWFHKCLVFFGFWGKEMQSPFLKTWSPCSFCIRFLGLNWSNVEGGDFSLFVVEILHPSVSSVLVLLQVHSILNSFRMFRLWQKIPVP